MGILDRGFGGASYALSGRVSSLFSSPTDGKKLHLTNIPSTTDPKRPAPVTSVAHLPVFVVPLSVMVKALVLEARHSLRRALV